MQELLLTKRPMTENPRADKRVSAYGQCFYRLRTIFVDANIRIKYKHKATYKDIVKTLVHELVHYRFSYMSHGAKFEQRIKEILEGRIFEPKHVQLFASYQSI
jgi:hypothetical protein